MSDDISQDDAAIGKQDSAQRQASLSKEFREPFRNEIPGDAFPPASGLLFEQAMAQTRMAVCLSDPHQPDMPIIFINRAFKALTGYGDEVIGQNCRFLQGPRTDPRAVDRIRQGLRSEDVVVVELINYRKDGTPFWNALHLGPIYKPDGTLLYYFGSQWDVTDVITARADERHAREMARELSHRMKNMFAVISSIVNITGRVRGVTSEAGEIIDRVQALGRAYETTLDDASSGDIELGQAIRAILEPYNVGDRIRFFGNGLRVPFQVISGVGLTLHELSANCVKHGAWSAAEGSVDVNWQAVTDMDGRHLEVSWIERDGPPVMRPEPDQGTGNAIVDRLLRHGGGTIERAWLPDGLRVFLRYPLGAHA